MLLPRQWKSGRSVARSALPPKPEICCNAKPVDAPCVFRAAGGFDLSFGGSFATSRAYLVNNSVSRLIYRSRQVTIS